MGRYVYIDTHSASTKASTKKHRNPHHFGVLQVPHCDFLVEALKRVGCFEFR